MYKTYRRDVKLLFFKFDLIIHCFSKLNVFDTSGPRAGRGLVNAMQAGKHVGQNTSQFVWGRKLWCKHC